MSARRARRSKKARPGTAGTRRAAGSAKRAKTARRKPAKSRAVAGRKPAAGSRRTAPKRAKPRAAVSKKRATRGKPARKGPAAKPRRIAGVPPAFAPQKAGATARDLLLFELERARVAVLAAIQGLGAGAASRPIAEGKWSPLEIVLHLGVRDRVRLEEFDRVRAGQAPTWKALDERAQRELNQEHLAALRGSTWDEAVRLLHTTRAELMATLQAVPAEPAGLWSESHPFGAMMSALVVHDRHHAEQIKRARVAG
jgi:hypothetical protein